MTETELNALMPQLDTFHQRFHRYFVRSEARARSKDYLLGLLGPVERKNVENVAEACGLNVRRSQMFLVSPSHDDAGCLQELRRLTAEAIGSSEGVLVVDDTGFPKDGTCSPGVARQYSGTLGKVGNCQIGVFLGYASELGHTLVDRRLYLPEKWTTADAQPRRERAGIPEPVVFQTKPEQAAELIQGAAKEGILPFAWVTGDAAYGDDAGLRDAVEAAGKRFLFEISCNTLAWLETPTWAIPAWKGRGRVPKREKPSSDPVRADRLAAQLPGEAWQRLKVADGAKGPRWYQFTRLRVVEKRDGKDHGPAWLVVRRPIGATDLKEAKYYLSNAPEEVSLERLAWVGSLRWTIEEDFKLAKAEVGLDHAETTKWEGWHLHTALTLLALGFLKQVQWAWGKKEPAGNSAGNSSVTPGRFAFPEMDTPRGRPVVAPPTTPQGRGESRSCQAPTIC